MYKRQLYNGTTLDCFTPAVTAVNILARQQGVTIGKQMIHCLKGALYNKNTMLDYEDVYKRQDVDCMQRMINFAV